MADTTPHGDFDSSTGASGESTSQSIISLLLILHLCAVGIAVVANLRVSSGLSQQLTEVPGVSPYVQALNMNTAYGYHLTHGMFLDSDHICDVLLDTRRQADISAESKNLPLYDRDSIWPMQRRQRYQSLALVVAQRATLEEQDSKLPYTIARKLLDEAGIKSGDHQFRCRRINPIQIERAESGVAIDPYAETQIANVYRANVWFPKTSRQLQIQKLVSAREAAQVENENGDATDGGNQSDDGNQSNNNRRSSPAPNRDR